MAGLFTMAKKEFLDIIGETKFLLIFGTLLIVILVSTFQGGLEYSSSQSSTTTTTTMPGGQVPGGQRPGANQTRPTQFMGSLSSLSTALSSMVTNFSLVGGVLAIAISFDTINSEKQRGSLSTLLSYPIYRDSIVYGKYVGGLLAVTLVSVVTFMAGIGVFLSVTGLALTMDTVLRLLIFFGVSLVYMAIFLAIGLLLSIVLPQPSTSLLASMIIWLSSIQLIPNLGYAIGQILYPVRMTFREGGPGFTMQSGFTTIRAIISGLSPSTAYENIVNSILTTSELQFTSNQPTIVSISVDKALLTVAPSLLYFVGLLIAIFAVAYIIFTRQEIR
ncbi:MAG: ABC transporter permease subunit [Candidatus Bathyarchaeota archaeon]|nr:ABC transporter permease subunit [Candidatus Bathyarchaeota archaeon]